MKPWIPNANRQLSLGILIALQTYFLQVIQAGPITISHLDLDGGNNSLAAAPGPSLHSGMTTHYLCLSSQFVFKEQITFCP
ncbi:unnamed protein product [Allacma fusca]|uniref:Uncharacterized protein n=1 Tax=Allacma fusca TaxID=39272 RepID=A0A8J2JE63_9HEXA|nr:unnamed protein product [Allacma fusca]